MCSLVLSEIIAKAEPGTLPIQTTISPQPGNTTGNTTGTDDDTSENGALAWGQLKLYIAAVIGGAGVVAFCIGLLWSLNVLRSVVVGARAGGQDELRRNQVVPVRSSTGQQSSGGSPSGRAVVDHLNHCPETNNFPDFGAFPAGRSRVQDGDRGVGIFANKISPGV